MYMWHVLIFAMWGISGLVMQTAEIKRGPDSGVIVFDSPGFLFADHQIKSKLIYLNLDPRRVIEKHMETIVLTDPVLVDWYKDHIERTIKTIQEILVQLQKILIKDDHSLVSQKPRRGKRWIGALFSAISVLTVIGTIVGTSLNVANSVQVKDLDAKIKSLSGSLQEIRRQLAAQTSMNDQILNVVNETVVIQGVHAQLLAHSTRLHVRHQDMWNGFFRFIDPISFLTQNYLRQLESNIGNLVRAKIPLYFVTTDMVKEILESMYNVKMTSMQVNIALEMGSAIPVYVDVENLHVSFLLNLPLIADSNVYLIKRVANVGFWKDDAYFKLQAPQMLAFQRAQEDFYLVPKVEACVSFKDIHFLCVGKPFLPDTEVNMCGIRKSRVELSVCAVEVAVPKHSKLDTVAILVKEQWLVSTKEKTYRIMYINHGTYQTIPLQYAVSMISVPRDTLVTVGDVTLFHISNETMSGAIEMVDLFRNRSIPVDEDLKFMLQHKETHVIQLTVKRDVGLIEHGYSKLDEEMMNDRWWMMIEWWCKLGVLLMICMWLFVLTVVVMRNAQVRRSNKKYKKRIERLSMRAFVPTFDQDEL